MSEILRLRSRAEIDEEAALWTWRMEGERVDLARRQAFDLWLRQDPRHPRAYDDFAKLWRELDGLAEAKGDNTAATLNTFRAPRGGSSPLRWSVAATLLILIAGGFLWMRPSTEAQALATAVGQERKVLLADGSVITLNTNTIIETQLTTSERQIYLRKGEAHFQVAHDRSRPFFVHAGDTVVRAVGTEFEVRVRPDRQVDVIVNEGRVLVQGPGPSTAASGIAVGSKSRSTQIHVVQAGEALSTSTSSYLVQSVSSEQLGRVLAWREGVIILDGEPLSEAVAEIERYTDARIIMDPSIGNLRIGGRFSTSNVPAFFDALQAALPVSVARGDDGTVYLSSRR
jgi:transmembrane sensor